jgi:hypothetical protein
MLGQVEQNAVIVQMAAVNILQFLPADPRGLELLDDV